MAKNVGEGVLKLSDLERVSETFHRREKKSQLRAGDVVVVRIGNSGQAAKIPESLGEANCSGLVVIKRPSRVTADYLVHFLNSPDGRKQSVAEAKGSTRQTLNTTSIAAAMIPVPALAEQRRIAEILDKADALRANRRAGVAQFDILGQSIFLEMFGDPVTNPKRWPVERLGGLISLGPQNGLYKPASDYGSGTPILRIDAFYDGVVTSLSGLKRVRLSDREKSLYGLQPGDIVINRVNSREYLGKSALIPFLPEPVVFESNMMRFGLDQARIDSVFLIRLLQTKRVRAHILSAAKDAVNQSSINQQDVKSIPVMLPPLKDQRRFAQLVKAANGCAERQRTQLQALDCLFASLQHRAFRGEL
jgi:type I restriction enzyme S subunit